MRRREDSQRSNVSIRKANNFLRAKALKLWRERVAATKLVTARRAAQDHCNAIFKSRNDYKKLNPQRRAAYRARAERGELLGEDFHPCAPPSRASPPVPDERVPPLASPTVSNEPPPSPPPPPEAPSPPPLPPGPPPEPEPPSAPAPAHRTITVEDVEAASKSPPRDPTRQWYEDYNRALEHARSWSQQQWDAKMGWAAGRETWYAMGGYPFVAQMTQARQEQDQQYARFQANLKNMQRVQEKQNEAQAKYLARVWQAQQDRLEEKRAELDFEQKRVNALETEISEVEKQGEECRTRYAVLREYLDNLEAATEAERRELSAQRCEQLRMRTEGTYDANLAVNECVLCFSEPCDQIATGCNHVIGCEACVVKYRNCHGNVCPICKEPTTFQKMHFP